MARSVQQTLDSGDLNKHGAAFNLGKVGTGLRLIQRFASGTVTSNVLTLPDDAKALAVLQAIAIAGTSTGGKTPVPSDATLAAGQVKANGAGNIEFFGTDAVTSAEVTYITADGQVFTEEIPVTAAGVGTLRSSRTSVLLISAVLSDDASSGGEKAVQPRGATPSAGQAALNLAGQPTFASADVGASPSTAVVSYHAKPGTTGALESFGDRLDADYPE